MTLLKLAAALCAPLVMFAGIALAAEPAETPVQPQATAIKPAAAITKRHLPRLIEPALKLSEKSSSAPNVALTFDACMGKADHRILDTLVAEKIPATIFVTGRWLKHNPEAFAVMKANPDLFEIEDHGANHIPAVDRVISIYGIAAAGSPQAVASEVTGGADAIVAAGAAKPQWFRGATAKYTRTSIHQIEAMGYKIAGFSINGDGGSLLGAAVTEKHYASARDGDVIISHINQPTHSAGEGVVRGIIGLKNRGFHFVLLRDQPEVLGLSASR